MMVSYRAGKAVFRRQRRGAVAPLLAFVMVVLIGFLALAIDIGMLAISKVQAQNAADTAALAAARTLSGPAPSNQGQATSNAQNILGFNKILGQTIQPTTQLKLDYGSYDYNQTTQTFNANFPPTSGVPISAVNATFTTISPPTAFAGIFGANGLGSVTATAQAVHRPRDVAMVMDLSGSMRFGSLSRYDFYTGSGNTTNNPDPNVPAFMHYSSPSAAMVGPSTNRTSSFGNYTISPSNITAPNASYTQTYVNNFYANAAYAPTLIRAFDSYTSNDGGNTWQAPGVGTSPQLPPASYATLPGGDVPLMNKGSSTVYAPTVQAVLGGATMNILWELDGYSAYVQGKLDTSNGGNPAVWTQADYSKQPFNGYTQGPGYFGKTFFIWPPDPRNAAPPGGATGGSVPAVGTVSQWLTALGMNSTDASTVQSNWGSWTLAQLQSWMTGTGTLGGPYKTTGPFVASTQAPIYYAVCRLFNRAYPAGSSNGALVADWRVRFFGTNNNTILFNTGTGSLNLTNLNGGSLRINYGAILQWLAQTPNPFPAQLRAGRIKYYGSIPTQITGTWPSYGGTDQRFWKECIDYMLGLYQYSAGRYADVSKIGGYNGDFTWGTTSVSGPPTTPPQYMSYTNNPKRGQLRYWFGPLMMVDYLANYNLFEDWTIPLGMPNGGPYIFLDPGDGYIAPNYSGKQAFLAAVTTMQTNHPNDWFALMYYNTPRNSSGAVYGFHNCVACPLGTNYAYANSALFFPFSTINADGSPNNTEVTPYDPDPATGNVPSANFQDIPRASGSTSFAMGLMLAYNQLITTPASDTTLRTFVSTSPIAFPTGMAGGLGRKGAQKVVIFETDGMANYPASDAAGNAYNATPSGTLTGPGYSPATYFRIRYNMNNPTSSEYPAVIGQVGDNSPSVVAQITGLVTRMQTDFGTTRNPFRLYAIGFGPVFAGPDAGQATATLTSMQTAAGVTSSPTIVTGTDAKMTANMTTAFTNILQNGIQIALTK